MSNEFERMQCEIKRLAANCALMDDDCKWPLPVVLNWLGDRREGTPQAKDARGCVLYFETQADCSEFMNWLAREHARRP